MKNETKSEWEELEKLSKDELIIELVRERTLGRDIKDRIMQDLGEISPKYASNVRFDDDGFAIWGAPTTDEWAEKILLYAKTHCNDCEFDVDNSRDYGLDEVQADETFDKLAKEGKLDWPSDDPRSRRFSGVSGYYADEVAAMTPEERERMIREEQEYKE